MGISGPVWRLETSDEHGAVAFRDLPAGRYRTRIGDGKEGWNWSLMKEWDLGD